MGRGFGIAALVFSIIAIFIPLLGLFIGWLALILAVFAALGGEIAFTIAVVLISTVDFFFMTPVLWIGTAAAHMNPPPGGSPNLLLLMSTVMVIAPVVALVFRVIGKAALGNR